MRKKSTAPWYLVIICNYFNRCVHGFMDAGIFPRYYSLGGKLFLHIIGLENNNRQNHSALTIQTPSRELCCPHSTRRDLFIHDPESAKAPTSNWSLYSWTLWVFFLLLWFFKPQNLTPHPSRPPPVFCFNIIQFHLRAQPQGSLPIAPCGHF